MSEATDLLSRFFAEKAISGDPITPEESDWIQSLLTPSQSEPSQITHFDDSQSVVFQGEPEPNCFLSQSSFGFSQPSGYDSQEVLRKYQHYYSASQEMQPSQLSKKKPQGTPKPLLASLDSQRVLTPILETFKAKPHQEEIKEVEEMKIDKDKAPEEKVEETSKETKPGLTDVACAIIQVLGDPSKPDNNPPLKTTATPTTEASSAVAPTVVPSTAVTPAVATPAVISIPVLPMTPSPAAVVKPFVVDTPIDSETFPKRIRTAEPERPVVTPVKNKEPAAFNFSLGSSTQPSQPSLETPTEESVILPPYQEPSLPVFEFHSPSSAETQSDNSLRREARQCSSGELPEFVF